MKLRVLEYRRPRSMSTVFWQIRDPWETVIEIKVFLKWSPEKSILSTKENLIDIKVNLILNKIQRLFFKGEDFLGPSACMKGLPKWMFSKIWLMKRINRGTPKTHPLEWLRWWWVPVLTFTIQRLWKFAAKMISYLEYHVQSLLTWGDYERRNRRL